MKKSPLLEELRKGITEDIKNEIDLSFAIADRIAEILAKKNMSQREFAAKLGKSEAEISKWMRGTHNFTTATLTKIASELGEPIIEVTGKPIKKEVLLMAITSDEFTIKTSSKSKGRTIPLDTSFDLTYEQMLYLNFSEKSNLLSYASN